MRGTGSRGGVLPLQSQLRRAFAEHKHASMERSCPVLASPTKRRLQTDVRAHLASTSRRHVVTNETSFPVPASAVLDLTDTSDAANASNGEKHHPQGGVASTDGAKVKFAVQGQDGGGHWEAEPGTPMSHMVRTKKLIQVRARKRWPSKESFLYPHIYIFVEVFVNSMSIGTEYPCFGS